MAIIYSYPSKSSVASGDIFVISDASDNNKTKQVTAQDIANFVDGEVTLQEVLNTDNRAKSDAGNTSTIILQDASVATTITLNGSNGEITTTGNISADGTLGVAGLSTLATVDINGGNIDDTIIGSAGPTNSFFTNMTADSVNIDGGNIDATIIGASTPAAGNFSTVNIDGGTIDSTLIGSSFASEAKFATQGTNSAVQVVGNFTGAAALRVFQGPIQFGNTGGLGYGNVGDVIKSNGSGGTPEWIAQDALTPSQVCQTVTNKSGGDLLYGDIVSIDPAAPNQAQPDVIKADNTTLLPAVGMVSDALITNNTEGKITKIGLIPDIDVAQFVGTTPVEGQVVYMAGGADAGKMTVDRPTGATTGIQNVGIITRVVGTNFDVQVVAIGRTNALPNNDANALFTTNASNLPISTVGKFEVDVANDTILVGDGTGTTDVTINSYDFRCEVKNDTAAGIENLQIGYQSLEQAMDFGGTARSNVAIGIRAMQGLPGGGIAASGSYNVAVGNDTLNSNSNLFGNVTGNTAIGHQALQGGPTNIADYNTAVGYQSLINLAGVAVGTADDNTAVGAFSLFNVTSGGENTSIGVGSGQAIVTGNQNTFLGHNSGTTIANMSNATAIGQNADVQGINGTALGQDSLVVGNNSIALGKGATATGPGVVNINVSGINGATPNGGLFVTAGTAPPPGLSPGDVFVIDATAPNNPTGFQLLAIMP